MIKDITEIKDINGHVLNDKEIEEHLSKLQQLVRQPITELQPPIKIIKH